MYTVSSEWIKDQLLTFGYGVNEDSTGDPKGILGFIHPIIDGVVEAVNLENPDDIWDIVRRFEIAMNGHHSIEYIFSYLTKNIFTEAKQAGYDPRMKFKVRVRRIGRVEHFIFEMDLDATVEHINNLNKEESTGVDIDDIISDNPTVDVLQKLENVEKREIRQALNHFTTNVLRVRTQSSGANRRYLHKRNGTL